MIFKVFAGNMYVGMLFADTHDFINTSGIKQFSGYILDYKKLNLRRVK